MLSSDRSELLKLLVDDEVLEILKQRLSPEERADLVMEIINPYQMLSTDQKARLAGVSPRALRDRRVKGLAS